ncbi:hypothetical protein AB9F39_37965, partial [Rhizobium leguminosarum]
FVESVFVPYPAAASRFAAYKITKRRYEDITAVLGAFLLTLDEAEMITDIRVSRFFAVSCRYSAEASQSVSGW